MENENNPEHERTLAIENQMGYLGEFLELKPEDKEKIEFVEISNLADEYTNQIEFLEDERLNSIFIAKIPDELWHKGNQPTESHAERQVVLFQASYFDQEKPDSVAWLTHEAAHCKRFLDLDSSEKNYNQEMQTPAFEDIDSESTYPNNKIEEFTFTKQFLFLKEKGNTREEAVEELKKYYNLDDPENKIFFNRILDIVYS